MQIIKDGHEYLLDHIDGTGKTKICFVNRGHGVDSEGVLNQEVLRVLIDRMKYLEKEKHWHGNRYIIESLRIALVLHEARHLERLLEKGELNPEFVQIESNGHFSLR